ncbi:MAG: decaprenylphospho-beta-D-erythro-pentofuranosid-2-ulose 2-reductase [Actinomycetota bacterium]
MRDGLGGYGTVLVLGGASDIGVATARALVRVCTRCVVLAGRRASELENSARAVRASGTARVETATFDALETEKHEGFVRDVAELYGDIDLAVLTFGVLGDQRAAEDDPSLALDVARTNYLGAISVLLPLAARMREQGHGSIVVLSSVAGERGRCSNFVYGSSKAGLDVFCQGLADRLHGSGVNVLVVRPGFVRSKMTSHLDAAPLSTTPDKVAAAILAGLREGRDTVWVPPALRWVMSALRHLPRPLFRRLEI